MHGAAYAALGLDWEYSAVEVASGGVAAFLGSLDDSWLGLSLTMPLKREVLPLLDVVSATAELTGGANTVLIGDELRGFNTDVFGITEAFRSNGIRSMTTAQIVGGGATAASALVAVHELGAREVTLTVRDSAKTASLVALASALEIDLVVAATARTVPDAVISTLPGHSEHGFSFDAATRESSVLLDVAYDPWPSALAGEWLGGSVISGIEMLTLQALAQVRVFVHGDPEVPLDREDGVLAAMRSAVSA